MSSVWNPVLVPNYYASPNIGVIVNTLADARKVPPLFASVTTLGYWAIGDGGENTYNLVTTGPADNGGTYIVGLDGTTTRKAVGNGGSMSVAQWGCVSGVDSSTYLQAAENWLSANGGGELIIPGGFTLVAQAIIFKSGVSYRGAGTLSSTSAFSGASVMQVATGGEIFGYTAARCTGKRFSNLFVRGSGAVAGNVRGFWMGKDNTMGNVAAPFAQYAALPNHSAERITYENIAFDNFRQEALMEESGSGTMMNNCWSQNVLQDQTYLTAQRGGVTCFMSDGRYTDCEFGGLPGNNGNKVTSTNLYAAAFWLAGKAARAKSFVTSCVGEQADIGFLIDQIGAHLSNCRGDQNNGPGFVFRYTNCNSVGGQAWNNSRDTTNLYDGVVVESTALGTRIGDMESVCQTSISNAHRYAFRDDVSQSVSPRNRTTFVNCVGNGYGTAEYFSTNPLSSGEFVINSGAPIFLTTNSVVPSVDGIVLGATNNTSATGITDFPDSNPNKTLRVLILDTNTSFVNGTTLKTTTGANVAATQFTVYSFTRRNGIWYMEN